MNRVRISASHGSSSAADWAKRCQVDAGSAASASSWAARTSSSVDCGHIPPDVADPAATTVACAGAVIPSFEPARRHTTP
jgi:hypothetical protein